MQRELWAARDADGELMLFNCDPELHGHLFVVPWGNADGGAVDPPQSLLPDLPPGEKRRVRIMIDEQPAQ